MSYSLANGSTIQIEATSGPTFAITGATNANPTVVAAADADATVGDIIVIDSLGWTPLSGRGFRASAVSAAGFTLGGVDTTNTTDYPAGGAVGEGHIAATFVQIAQVTDVASSGGEQQFLTFGFLEERYDRQIPTTKSPASLTLTVADDPNLPFVAICEAADRDQIPRAIKINKPNGESMVFAAYVTITPVPALARNELITRQITLSFQGLPIRYEA